jgi:hypothetical protein
MLESDYVQAELFKPPPLLPVRVSRKSQLVAALRQRARSIVIENEELARPFARLLEAREFGDFIADTISEWIVKFYGTEIEAQWYMGRYILPGNVRRVIFKPKQISHDEPSGTNVLSHHVQTRGNQKPRD